MPDHTPKRPRTDTGPTSDNTLADGDSDIESLTSASLSARGKSTGASNGDSESLVGSGGHSARDGEELDEEDIILDSGKRRRGRPAGKTKESPTIPSDAKITYILTILSKSEAAKATSKRKPVNECLKLAMDEPWDTFKAQLLVKIDNALSPSPLDFSHYQVMVSISRALPKPGMVLSTADNYADLMTCIQGLTKLPIINISIEQRINPAKKKATQADEMAEGSDAEEDAPKEKKGKKKKAPVILPGNENRAKKVCELQERWECKDRRSTCVGTLCYIFPATSPHKGTHLPLNPERLECWASSMLKDPITVDKDTPPNHHLFDLKNGVLSPVLQRRLDEQNAKATAQPANTLKITLGESLVTILEPLVSAVAGSLVPRLVPQPAPATVAVASSTTAAAAPSTAATMLLGSDRVVGPDITMLDFCATYKLAPPILELFNKHSFTQARWLHFLSLGDLDTMG
ncbi:hypothetical protein BDN72DRAFT_843463, partial [Pluteus cervinus]